MFFFKLLIFLKSFEEEDDDRFFVGDFSDILTNKEINWSSLPIHDVIIIGSGPAGNTAALYTARSNLNPIIFHGHVPGGQLTLTTEVENFPSFTGTGPQLIQKMQSQAIKFGAKYINEKVIFANLSINPKRLLTDDNHGYLAKSIIIATGANAKYLGLPSEERFKNRGLSACATCDGPLFKNQQVAVVGGGDTAAHEAIHLSKICKSVKMIVRGSQLRASSIMKKQLNKSNIQIYYNTTILELIGGNYLTGIQTKNLYNSELKSLSVNALFLAIGHEPATEPFKNELDVDKNGFFITKGNPKTKIPGVFVAGDCADKIYRQAATSVGSGCQAALLSERFLLGEEI